jgi:GntR family transcriptional regulator
MFLFIDAHNGLAVYEQIVRQVKFAVADGVLSAGDLAPSVRELAKDLAINPNTVARAYRQLQDDDVLTPIRGTGLAVASGARRACQSERKRLIRARLHDVLLEAHSSGLDEAQIHSIFKAELVSARRKQR